MYLSSCFCVSLFFFFSICYSTVQLPPLTILISLSVSFIYFTFSPFTLSSFSFISLFLLLCIIFFFISYRTHSVPPSLVSFPRVFLSSPLRYGLVFISSFIFTIAFYCMSLDIVNILTLILVLLLSSLLLSHPIGRAMTGQELAACFPPPFLASSLPPFFHSRLRKRMSGGRNGNMSPSDLLSSLPPSLPPLLSLALLSPQVTYSYSTTRGMK